MTGAKPARKAEGVDCVAADGATKWAPMNLAPGRQRRAIADFFARWRGAAAIRRERSLRACLLRLFFAVGTAALAADAVVLPRGTVSAGVVRGEVVLVTGAGRVPLARGAAVPVGAAVVTASASSAQLRLSDGAVVSRFTSVWRREADGRWRVIVDQGVDACGK